LLPPAALEVFGSFRGFDCLGDAAALLGLFRDTAPASSVGPFEREICTAVTLKLRTIGRPIGESVVTTLTCVDGMMKRRVDDARRDTIGDQGSQGRLPGAACNFHPIALIDATLLGNHADGFRDGPLRARRHSQCGRVWAPTL